MAAPPNVAKLQQAVETAMEDLQRQHLIPTQKQAFLCSAKCCDQHNDLGALQQCAAGCQRTIAAAQEAMFQRLSEFQERFQRCTMRCQDAARESLPSDPKPKDIERAQAGIGKCLDACGGEYAGKVPKLKADVEAALKKI